MSLGVRQVDAADAKNAALLRWLQLEILPYDEPLTTDSGWWWVAFDADRPVGFAGMHKSSQWDDAAYLCRSGVIEAVRGKGLQKRFIRARETKARVLGCRWVITDTTDNPASANSLISCGFKMFSPTNPWGNPTACYWRKELKR